MGLNAGANPFMLATALIFAGLLSIYRHSRSQLIISGSVFLFTVWVVNFFVLNGNFDHLIYQPHIESLSDLTYSVLSVLFLYIGFLHFNDWMLLKQGKDVPMLRTPSPRGIDASGKSDRWYRYIYLFFIFAVIAWHISIFEARLTQNYYLFIIMLQMIKMDAVLYRAFASFLTYMLGYTFLLWALWALCLGDSYSMRFRSQLNRYLGMEKLVFAALFWGTSVGLLFFLLNIRRWG